jgi:hypothetical protein
MDGDSDARTESPVWRLLAFSGFLLINLVSTIYVLEYGHRQVEKAVREAPAAIFRSGQEYSPDPRALLEHRRRMGEVLEKLLGR